MGVRHALKGPGPGAAAVYLPPDPASGSNYQAGEVAQCDLWFPPVRVPMGVRAGPDDHRPELAEVHLGFGARLM